MDPDLEAYWIRIGNSYQTCLGFYFASLLLNKIVPFTDLKGWAYLEGVVLIQQLLCLLPGGAHLGVRAQVDVTWKLKIYNSYEDV